VKNNVRLLFCSPISERSLLCWKAISIRPLVLLMRVLRYICCLNACRAVIERQPSCFWSFETGLFFVLLSDILDRTVRLSAPVCWQHWHTDVADSVWQTGGQVCVVVEGLALYCVQKGPGWSDQVDAVCSFYQSVQMNTWVLSDNRLRHCYCNCSQTSQIVSKILCVILPAQTVLGW